MCVCLCIKNPIHGVSGFDKTSFVQYLFNNVTLCLCFSLDLVIFMFFYEIKCVKSSSASTLTC